MNQLSAGTVTCADLQTKAEQELGAFFSAVRELFGSTQAKHSAEDWLHELMAMNRLPASTREWRLLTVKVSARLANRLNGQKAVA
jgi:cell wall assembly regulator SMI1